MNRVIFPWICVLLAFLFVGAFCGWLAETMMCAMIEGYC